MQVAVVGESGCGKSTLGSLLLRLYQPDSGSVLLDGVNIEKLDPVFLRRYIGTVSQEPILFSNSIKENILYGVEDPDSVTQEELEKATREANAHSFIMKFPDGYDTLVGERGIMLSGDRNSVSPSPGPFSRTRESCCWMKPPVRSMLNLSTR